MHLNKKNPIFFVDMYNSLDEVVECLLERLAPLEGEAIQQHIYCSQYIILIYTYGVDDMW